MLSYLQIIVDPKNPLAKLHMRAVSTRLSRYVMLACIIIGKGRVLVECKGVALLGYGAMVNTASKLMPFGQILALSFIAPAMESLRTPFKGIIGDIKGRGACYKEDWASALFSGIRLLAPTAYIFFASALPVIAFGEQLYRNTVCILQLIRKKMVQSAKECIKQHRSNSEIYGRMQAVFVEMDISPSTTAVAEELQELKQAVMKSNDEGNAKGKFDPEKHIDAYLPVRIGKCYHLWCVLPCEQEKEPSAALIEASEDEFYNAEILDEMTTNRGELKHRTLSINEDSMYQVHPQDEVRASGGP
ncbi:Boron transporter 4 [Tripterygium wilfordii]|uniref:Boron transporter 4 n=1 Tax=Tripterygium wilfordii TaxID=458696 RepID=A0A7J7DPK6_TRIWF|nr:Boron transporter 4 [Tripterygium wilfordii]